MFKTLSAVSCFKVFNYLLIYTLQYAFVKTADFDVNGGDEARGGGDLWVCSVCMFQ